MSQDATAGAGRIVTFYSYKGGTGRTMAVANVAWILAMSGKRVLAIDWDLESPGLHRYFHPFLVDKKLRSSRGIIDLIRSFADAAVEPPHEGASAEGPPAEDPQWYQAYADVEREAVSLVWKFPGNGVIDFLPAGQQDRSYSSAVSTFEWPSFYDRLNGGVFLNALRDNMRAHYDYVLIDSRTGLSDTASICTVQLPDVVVDCFTLSEQSIDGAASVAESIADQRPAEPVRLLPVPMRVEDAEQIKLEAGRDYARQRFAGFLRMDADAVDRYWGDVEIPYKPFYAYEEILAVFGDRSRQESSLLAAFERLTRIVTDGDVTELVALDERDRRRWLAEFERPKPTATSDVLVSYSAVDRMWAEWIATELGDVGLRVTLQEVDLGLAQGAQGDVEELLNRVNRTLVLVSQDYVRSPGAADFWRLALGRDPTGGTRFLVPVRLDSSWMATPFSGRHPAVDFANLAEERAREALLVAFDQPYGPGLPDRRGTRDTDPGHRGPRFPGTPPPVWRVPQRNISFTGRGEVLEGLRNRLSANVTVVVPQALYGLGGVGKTQVALEYAHRFAADYDIVWWIAAEQPSQVRASLADLANELGLLVPENLTETVEAVLDALRRGEPHWRWLIVFDNADNPDELREYLPQGPGHVLLTSRNLDWTRRATAVEVGVFSRQESVSFLRHRVPALSIEDATQVAERLGDLPLAIEQAGAWLAATGMPVGQYLELLDTQLPRVLEENPPPGYERTAAATWLLSLERLREQMPAAAKLLEVCAFFAPEPISMKLLYSERFVEVLLPFDPSLNEPLLQGRLVQEIGRYALASIDSAQSTIQLHRLVQAVIRARLTPQEQEANRRHVHETLAAANPKDPDVPENWPLYAELRVHLEASGALSSTKAGARQLLIDMVRYLWKFSDYQSSQDLAEKTIEAWQHIVDGEADLTTLWMNVHLANSLRSQAKFTEAHDIDEATHEALLRRVGPDHPYTITCLTGRAADLRSIGLYEQARALDEEILQRSSYVLGDNHHRTLNAANNLAVSLRLVGDFRAATDLDEVNLQRRRRVLGERHPMTLISSHHYGRDLRDIGRYQEARKMLESTLTAMRLLLGDDHPETLRTAKTLAVTLRKLGELAAAHALTQDTLARTNQALGRRHPDTLSCATNLACDQSALGDDRSARKLAEETLERYRETLGEDQPFTLACANNLAIFMRKLGEHASARPLAKGIVDRFQQTLGEGHPYTLACLINYANELFEVGEYAAALNADREAFERLTEKLGEAHPDTLAAGNNYAITLRVNGDRGAAQRLIDGVVERSTQTLGEQHPNTAAVHNGARLNCDIDPPAV